MEEHTHSVTTEEEEVYVNTIDGSATFRDASKLIRRADEYIVVCGGNETHLFTRENVVQIAVRPK